MKTLLTFLIFVQVLLSLSQNRRIEEISFEKKLKKVDPIYQTLGIKDTSSLLIQIGVGNNYSGYHLSRYINYQGNGKVMVYIVQQKNKITTNSKIKIKRKKRKEFWNLLNIIISSKNYTFDQRKLNIQEKESPQVPGEITIGPISLSISDGSHYNIQFILGRKLNAFGTYEPHAYIANNFPGKEERQRFMRLYEELDEIIKSAGS